MISLYCLPFSIMFANLRSMPRYSYIYEILYNFLKYTVLLKILVASDISRWMPENLDIRVLKPLSSVWKQRTAALVVGGNG